MAAASCASVLTTFVDVRPSSISMLKVEGGRGGGGRRFPTGSTSVDAAAGGGTSSVCSTSEPKGAKSPKELWGDRLAGSGSARSKSSKVNKRFCEYLFESLTIVKEVIIHVHVILLPIVQQVFVFLCEFT